MKMSFSSFTGAFLLLVTQMSWASCNYVVNNHWGSGFVGSIQITNDSSSIINGWSISWQYAGDNRITSGWNANLGGSNPYSASNVSWNASIQPGQTIEFGF